MEKNKPPMNRGGLMQQRISFDNKALQKEEIGNVSRRQGGKTAKQLGQSSRVWHNGEEVVEASANKSAVPDLAPDRRSLLLHSSCCPMVDEQQSGHGLSVVTRDELSTPYIPVDLCTT